MERVNRQVAEVRRVVGGGDDWKSGVDAVARLADAFEALGRPEDARDAVRQLVYLAPELNQQLTSKRSATVKAACADLERIVVATGVYFSDAANSLIPTIACLAKSSSTAFRVPSANLLGRITELTRYDLQLLKTVFVKEKAHERVCVLLMEQLPIAFVYWSPSEVSPYFADIVLLIDGGLHAGSESVRKAARDAVASLSAYWPDRLGELRGMPPQQRVELVREHPDSGIARALLGKYTDLADKVEKANARAATRHNSRRQTRTPPKRASNTQADKLKPDEVFSRTSSNSVSPALSVDEQLELLEEKAVVETIEQESVEHDDRVVNGEPIYKDDDTAAFPASTDNFIPSVPPEFDGTQMHGHGLPRPSFIPSPPTESINDNEEPSRKEPFRRSFRASTASRIPQRSHSRSSSISAETTSHVESAAVPGGIPPIEFSGLVGSGDVADSVENNQQVSSRFALDNVQPFEHGDEIDAGGPGNVRTMEAAPEVKGYFENDEEPNEYPVLLESEQPALEELEKSSASATTPTGMPVQVATEHDNSDSSLVKSAPFHLDTELLQDTNEITDVSDFTTSAHQELESAHDSVSQINSSSDVFDRFDSNGASHVETQSAKTPAVTATTADTKCFLGNLDEKILAAEYHPEPSEHIDTTLLEPSVDLASDILSSPASIVEVPASTHTDPAPQVVVSIGGSRHDALQKLKEIRQRYANLRSISKADSKELKVSTDPAVENPAIETSLSECKQDFPLCQASNQDQQVSAMDFTTKTLTANATYKTNYPVVHSTPAATETANTFDDDLEIAKTAPGVSAHRSGLKEARQPRTANPLARRTDNKENQKRGRSRERNLERKRSGDDVVAASTERGLVRKQSVPNLLKGVRLRYEDKPSVPTPAVDITPPPDTYELKPAAVEASKELSLPALDLDSQPHEDPVFAGKRDLDNVFAGTAALKLDYSRDEVVSSIEEDRALSHNLSSSEPEPAAPAPVSPKQMERSSSQLELEEVPLIGIRRASPPSSSVTPKSPRKRKNSLSTIIVWFWVVLALAFGASGLLRATRTIRETYEYHDALQQRIDRFEVSISESRDTVHKLEENYAVWSEYVRVLAEEDEANAAAHLEMIQHEVEKWQRDMKADLLEFRHSLSAESLEAVLAPLRRNATAAATSSEDL